MNARKRTLINSAFVACCLAAVSIIGYPHRSQEDRAGKAQAAKSELGSQENKRGDEERQASIQKLALQQKVVRDAYVRLMRYHTAARDEQAATSDVSYKPEDYVVFELRDMHVGPVEEILDRPIAELVTVRTGEVLKVTPHHLQFGKGPKHAYYDVEWISNSPSTNQADKTTVREFISNSRDSLADVDQYTSYEVTARLTGKVRVYRAIALHRSEPDSSGTVRTNILDGVTTEMSAVLADESPRVRSPWKLYIKTGLYLAVAKQIQKAERAGRPLIAPDAPIGYLPGDDVMPDVRNAEMRIAMVCAAPHIDSITPARGVRGIEYGVSIKGSGFQTPASVSVTGTGIAVSEVVVGSTTEILATFALAADASGGNHAVTVTVNEQTSDNSVNFYVQIPTTIRQDTLDPITTCDPTRCTIGSQQNACGAYRSVHYTLVDQDNPAQAIAENATVTETVKDPSVPNDPGIVKSIPTNEVGAFNDLLAMFKVSSCPSLGESISRVQTFSAKVGETTFSLTRVNRIDFMKSTSGKYSITITVQTQ